MTEEEVRHVELLRAVEVEACRVRGNRRLHEATISVGADEP